MIGTKFYSGQGFGNQLWVYAATRCIAERRGLDFGLSGYENFKGRDFLDLDPGTEFEDGSTKPEVRIPKGFKGYYAERKVIESRTLADITPFDPKLDEVPDDTLVDGTMQSERYLRGCREKIAGWFETSGPDSDECVISLRGGEYRNIPDVFLPQTYFYNAMEKVRQYDPGVKFSIVTDDLPLARKWFPDLPATSSGGVKRFWRFKIDPKSSKIGLDFSRIQHAKYLILSNSSFSWWGAYTNLKAEIIIAPKYWARFNTSDGFWSNGDSLTSGWLWLDREGVASTYDDCLQELNLYRNSSKQ